MPTSREWTDEMQLDQEATNHCVGFGWAGWGDSEPVTDGYRDPDGHAIYYEAKEIDGEPRGERGSTVRSGAKAMRNRRRLGAFVFADNVDDVKRWVLTRGPVVCGTDWTRDMFDPDTSGFVRPTGSVEGGHCYLMVGYDGSTDTFSFVNSWGSAWGQGGRFHMRSADFARLLKQQGEACAGIEVPL
jgi:hypothetical protein